MTKKTLSFEQEFVKQPSFFTLPDGSLANRPGDVGTPYITNPFPTVDIEKATINKSSPITVEVDLSAIENVAGNPDPKKSWFSGFSGCGVSSPAAYSEFITDYKNTYFKEVFDVLSSRYKLGRVRILLKQPRSTLSWHRDPEPRLHIPIITNPGSIMVIDNVAKHLPADGSVWITNNTKYHNAFNGGEENRIHLVACVLDHKFN